MTKKQSKTKRAGGSRKATKTAAPARAEKTPKASERDPRLPAAGTTIVRPYKGKEHRIKVLADGFEHEGTHYRSLTALARVITGYKAISGPAWAGIAERAPATPKGAKGRKSAEPTDAAAEPARAAESAAS